MRNWRTWWRWWTARYGHIRRRTPAKEVEHSQEEETAGLPPVARAATLLRQAGSHQPGSKQQVGWAARRLQRELGNQSVQRLVQSNGRMETAVPELSAARERPAPFTNPPGRSAQQQAAGSKKEAKRLQKLLDFLALVKAGQEIPLTKRNAKVATGVLEQADAGTSGFTISDAERKTLLTIQNRGEPTAEPEPDEPAEKEPATEEPQPEELVVEPEEDKATGGITYADFSYDKAWAKPPRELDFDDFREAADGSLDPDAAQVEAGIEGDSKNGVRFYYAKLHDTVMEKTYLVSREAELLQHERLHWAIWCRLAQIANEAIAGGVSHTKIDPIVMVIGHELTKQYDDETDHSRNIAGQQDWNANWHRYIDSAFNDRL